MTKNEYLQLLTELIQNREISFGDASIQFWHDFNKLNDYFEGYNDEV